MDKEFSKVFTDLLRQWEKDTMFQSSYTKIQEHPNNQKIVDLGAKAISLLLERTKTSPCIHCHVALRSITGLILDVPKEHIGKTKEIARIWINWGKENGYIK